MRFNRHLLLGGIVVVFAIACYVLWKMDFRFMQSSKRSTTSMGSSRGEVKRSNLDGVDNSIEACNTTIDEYRRLVQITHGNIMESKQKQSIDVAKFPVCIRKQETSKYFKFSFKPALVSTTIYGFFKEGAEVEMAFKLVVTKVGSKNYELRINRRITQSFDSMTSIEISMRDQNQLLFVINEGTSIPLFVMNLQYLILDSDSNIKYYEGLTKK